jgi:fructosamine-3-kinase
MNFSEWQQIATSAQLDAVIDIAPIGSGDEKHSNWQLNTSKGRFFVRTTTKHLAPILASEADALNAIAHAQSTLMCAEVIGQGCTTKTAWLVQRWEALTRETDKQHAEQLGLALATLHRCVSPSKQYGWHQTNFIDDSIQHNHWLDDWTAFYRSQRLLPQIHIAQKQGLSTSLIHRLYQVLDRMPDFFYDYQPEASLIHGNLRQQHHYINPAGQIYVTQPASCYADREMDLAALSLTQPLGQLFYAHYEKHLPRQANHQRRLPLYQLYYTLIDFNRHGSRYIEKLTTLLAQLEVPN